MNVAFIPVRGGSKSIPLKNIKSICGMPLIYWTMKAACECEYIDKIYISTDSEKIRTTINEIRYKFKRDIFEKVNVIERSEESASDTAPTEFAMLEFAEKYEFDNIVLIQATSPMLNREDLNKGFEIFMDREVDSVLSVVRQKRFHWVENEQGYAEPSNYDIFNRPRRQVFDGCFVENGAFYINSKKGLIKYKNRLCGNIKMVEMSEDTYFEIDEPSDWIIIEALMKENGVVTKNDKMVPEIKMFLTDCDGCLTDGGMYYSENGDELKKFNTCDGMGFSILQQKGIITGIITSEDVNLNRRRAEKLKLDIVETGVKDKEKVIRSLSEKFNIPLCNICYIGDDINDLKAVKIVGFGCCPSNAMPEIKNVSKYITYTKGGEGVIREIVELICN